MFHSPTPRKALFRFKRPCICCNPWRSPSFSSSDRRWKFKSGDPQVLAQIDRIFVTLESKDGNRSPSGRPFLYADLRSAPACGR